MKQTEVSKATMGRIPIYFKHLRKIAHDTENISATALAKELGFGEVQVRKDLNSVSGAGRPKTGYKVDELIASLEEFLNVDKRGNVVIVGAGKLGRALLEYEGFKDYGLDIVAAFDNAVREKEVTQSGKKIYPIESFGEFCKNNSIKIGIITVPSKSAQEVCELLLDNGIKAIWCFAPCMLSVPKDIPVQYENMALSLAYLNKRI